ncbi:Membrane protein involved in the export of O-antigen and teichoic acid [Lacrimispora sphenoides]|uniref:lipopolysaccharide biosynthesis protein n=1 Tax=Lacrimispora sphenoides TaxID=29370 RepID=UPI0008AF40B5|nr:oligosaccharide flippase family protein [Lacrimispora sphenoides]SET90706.1 Membrane protein involved in the export of O-antigen and teichoic acid [Lacrimispora sphenoides]
MKIERINNASRNIVFGGLLKIYQIVIPFLMRTIMIYFMGVQYLGLNSLFASVLQVLNLAELGVGSAMVFSMYKPIADDDEVTICALMKLYRRYYNIIGLIIAILGTLLTPFIPKIINGDVPVDTNIYILYLLNLGATVLSYWLLAYKNSILQAHQRIDVISKINLVTNTIQYALQIMVLIFLRNYYIYVLIMLTTQILTNILTAIIATKKYPDYKPIGTLPDELIKGINQKIKDLFTSKIGAIIVNSADTIVISAFLGLTVLAIYQNYYFILTAVIGIVEVVFTACTAGIGNSLIVEPKEKNFNDLNKFTFMIAWVAGFCACCFLNLYQPFMEIWVGRDLMLQYSAVVCLCIYFFIYEINRLLNTYKDAGGIWHQDRFRPLVTAIANLGMNLIMVQFWGIYGIILSTVLSMLFIGMPWILYNLFTSLFEKRQLPLYLRKLGLYVIITFLNCGVAYFICSYINYEKWVTFAIRMIVCAILPNVVFFLAYRKLPEFNESISLLEKISKGKIKLSKLVR